jgi:hypothetical protein
MKDAPAVGPLAVTNGSVTPQTLKKPRKKIAAPVTRPRLALLKRVGEAIGVPYTSMLACAAKGEFATIKIGRLIYVEWVDIDRWIASRKNTAA